MIALRKISGRRFHGLLVIASVLIGVLGTASVASAFSVEYFDAKVTKTGGEPATQAGSHPNTAFTEFIPNMLIEADGEKRPEQSIKDMIVDLPPGFVGNPNSVPTCKAAQLLKNACPQDTQVGISTIGFYEANGTLFLINTRVYNLEAIPGHAATFGMNIQTVVTLINVSVRSGTDYGLRTEIANVSQLIPLSVIKLKLWGVPNSSDFDFIRGACMNTTNANETGERCPAEAPALPFLTLPTSCGEPQETKLTLTTWEGSKATAGVLSHDNNTPVANPIGVTGCNALDFSPSLEARPTTNAADSPSGLNVDLEIPQNTEATGTSSAHLRDAKILLPEGLVLNPSAANGLTGCSPAEIGLTSAENVTPVTFTGTPGECPDASKVGTVEIETPVLDHPLTGAMYIATPYDNPYDSLLAIYLSVFDPDSGVVVKIPGRIELDPATGRVTASFEENPQLPFSHLKINVFAGSRGVFRTPTSCGPYVTSSTLTPWSAPDSGPPATPSDEYEITQGAPEFNCVDSSAARPLTPSFEAGTESPIAGTSSPLVLNLRRKDGTQEFSKVTLSPPAGLLGKLAGIPACSEAALTAAESRSGAAEKVSPSCPTASEIGSIVAAAGAGAAPYYAPGKVYLGGPYKGAPLSFAIITPAVAGPFDLGVIVTRVAVFIDPVTSRITADADPIPSILKGIVLDVRSVSIRLDRGDFVQNPTSCNPSTFDGSLVSTLGQTVSLSNHFQLGECGRLGFNPNMQLTLDRKKRRAHPSLTAVVTTRPGDANLAGVSVAMPPTELLDQSSIDTVCTRVQFAADQCPPESIYGQASVTTPLLDQPLTGPVYLRSSSNPLPDLVTDLRGPASLPIKFEAAGKTDTVKGGLRNTFSAIPDAPLSTVVLKLNGGRGGLLQNTQNVCNKKLRATVKFTAQNGEKTERYPVLQAGCKKKKAKKTKRKHTRRGADRRSSR